MHSPEPNYKSQSMFRVFGPSPNAHLKIYYIQIQKITQLHSNL